MFLYGETITFCSFVFVSAALPDIITELTELTEVAGDGMRYFVCALRSFNSIAYRNARI